MENQEAPHTSTAVETSASISSCSFLAQDNDDDDDDDDVVTSLNRLREDKRNKTLLPDSGTRSSGADMFPPNSLCHFETKVCVLPVHVSSHLTGGITEAC